MSKRVSHFPILVLFLLFALSLTNSTKLSISLIPSRTFCFNEDLRNSSIWHSQTFTCQAGGLQRRLTIQTITNLSAATIREYHIIENNAKIVHNPKIWDIQILLNKLSKSIQYSGFFIFDWSSSKRLWKPHIKFRLLGITRQSSKHRLDVYKPNKIRK